MTLTLHPCVAREWTQGSTLLMHIIGKAPVQKLKTVISTFALGASAFLVGAPAQGQATTSIEAKLRYLGHEFRKDSNGDIALEMAVPRSSRTTVIHIQARIKKLKYPGNEKSAELKLQKVWCGMALDENITRETALGLLHQNANVKVGAWQVVGQQNVVFEANLSVGIPALAFETVLLALSESCDSMERKFEGEDLISTIDRY